MSVSNNKNSDIEPKKDFSIQWEEKIDQKGIKQASVLWKGHVFSVEVSYIKQLTESDYNAIVQKQFEAFITEQSVLHSVEIKDKKIIVVHQEKGKSKTIEEKTFEELKRGDKQEEALREVVDRLSKVSKSVFQEIGKQVENLSRGKEKTPLYRLEVTQSYSREEKSLERSKTNIQASLGEVLNNFFRLKEGKNKYRKLAIQHQKTLQKKKKKSFTLRLINTKLKIGDFHIVRTSFAVWLGKVQLNQLEETHAEKNIPVEIAKLKRILVGELFLLQQALGTNDESEHFKRVKNVLYNLTLDSSICKKVMGEDQYFQQVVKDIGKLFALNILEDKGLLGENIDILNLSKEIKEVFKEKDTFTVKYLYQWLNQQISQLKDLKNPIDVSSFLEKKIRQAFLPFKEIVDTETTFLKKAKTLESFLNNEQNLKNIPKNACKLLIEYKESLKKITQFSLEGLTLEQVLKDFGSYFSISKLVTRFEAMQEISFLFNQLSSFKVLSKVNIDGNQFLISYLIEPVQRAMRYNMLFNEALKQVNKLEPQNVPTGVKNWLEKMKAFADIMAIRSNAYQQLKELDFV